ncbi:MAG: phosphate acyltransferase PlsX [Candidatus Krumholzibacteria bacterium]|nr:phosphate acyltransferase PlsX [Candidatus Krumholzibacteria bacterium]
MRIALDAMGGDKAPEEIIDGAIEAVAAAAGRFDVVLVGQKKVIEDYMAERSFSYNGIEIVDAPEVVGMSESPATAIRRKKNSSIAVATRLQRDGDVQAVVSAGNTGAVVASSLLFLGRIPGIDRPGIAIFFPTRNGGTILLDGGANSDCSPKNLQQFAIMGSLYAELFLHRENPRIGLLSIGEESSKGNELTRGAHELLKDSNLNFVGNVEGRDIFAEMVDVVITDGFTGNVVLKFTESIIYYINSLIREGVEESAVAKLGALLMKPAFRRMKETLDYAEYGGVPLIGTDGVTIIGHGGSSAKAIKNAILTAERFIESGINERLRSRTEAAD